LNTLANSRETIQFFFKNSRIIYDSEIINYIVTYFLTLKSFNNVKKHQKPTNQFKITTTWKISHPKNKRRWR